jgi:exo-beta-1,3-glucanase (GH17 family)
MKVAFRRKAGINERDSRAILARLFLSLLIAILSVNTGGCIGRKTDVQPDDSDIERVNESQLNHDTSEAEVNTTPQTFEDTLLSLNWVAYAPTNWNPQKGISAPEKSLKADLLLLRKYFDGIVTYGANEKIPMIAKEVGFKGMLFGVWNPESEEEFAQARAAAQNEIILGFVVGNEGLDERYDYETLKQAIEKFSAATGKPVTTTEQHTDYANPRLLELGDWIFPNTHPYFHRFIEPVEAAEWTERQYKKLARKTGKPVLFKEVGLPSDGDEGMSEQAQAEYYRKLQRTSVRFVYFEAFDQPWKTHLPIEPHWGLFLSDRTPKLVVKYLPEK